MRISLVKSFRDGEYLHVRLQFDPENDAESKTIQKAQASPPDSDALQLIQNLAMTKKTQVPANFDYLETTGLHKSKLDVIYRRHPWEASD